MERRGAFRAFVREPEQIAKRIAKDIYVDNETRSQLSEIAQRYQIRMDG
jgi:hypothetical protein